MKYKIVEINELNLEKFDGKIVQIINSHKEDIMVGRDYLGLIISKYVWVLTCLVEVEE